MLKQEGTVKRNDLELRIKYIGLKTEIYQIDEYQFMIYCINYNGNFEELKRDFNYTIRQLSVNVTLTDKRPAVYLKIIDSIPLSNVVDGFRATCITEGDLNNFIKSKFYNIDITNIEIPQSGIGFEILIRVSRETQETEIINMHQYLLNEDLGTDKITIVVDNGQIQNQKENEISNNAILQQIERTNKVMQLGVIKELPFTITEADFWFEHAEDIYTGKMTRKDLYFFREGSLKCFLDFSLFDNIDLRNVLLLYDTVYIALPIESNWKRFFEQQNMTELEFIELIDMGKVVLVLSNLETRYRKDLLLEAFKCNPAAVIGRRGLNILLATHLTETKHQYEKRFPSIYEVASEIYLKGIEHKSANLQNMARMLAWPITATANSFRFLNLGSPMSISNFGINTVISENIKSIDKKDNISFEFTMNALSTHIATALQSTYFPFSQKEKDDKAYSDQVVSNIMGDFLKMYWYDATNLQNIRQTYNQNNTENNYLKMFECKHNIKITKIASLADEYNTPQGFQDLLMRLDVMDELHRKSKINDYNNLLFEAAKISNGNSKDYFKFMLGGAGFLPLNYMMSIVLSLIGIINDKVNASESMQKINEMKFIASLIKDSGIKKDDQVIEDVFLLDKISRVAILK